MTRSKLISLNLLTPAEHFSTLPEKDPKRVAYEKKMILIGDLDIPMPANTIPKLKVIINPVVTKPEVNAEVL